MKKALILKKVKKDFLKKKIFVLKVIQITQNFLTNKKKIQKQIIMKEKNLILRRVKKNLKIKIDLNHLNLKNIIEAEIELLNNEKTFRDLGSGFNISW